MSTRSKILFTIALALAVAYWLLFGCQEPSTSGRGVNRTYLVNDYKEYNERYFQNKLPAVEITLDEKKEMATTSCDDGGVNCIIRFNLRYSAAQRVADFTMLHEQCHIKTWDKDTNLLGVVIDHGPAWRTCMLELDAAGAFREIIIDNYTEKAL